MDSGEINRSHETDLSIMKNRLIGYRGYLVPLNKVLEWELPIYPGIVIGVFTFLFAILWYLEPSVLTVLSMVGIVVVLEDVAAPYISNHFYKQPENWREPEELMYERVCTRLMHAANHLHDAFVKLCKLRAEKPTVYATVACGVLLVLAWIGSLIDSLLLMYLLVVVLTLMPGLRKHRVIEKIVATVKSKVQKPKAN